MPISKPILNDDATEADVSALPPTLPNWPGIDQFLAIGIAQCTIEQVRTYALEKIDKTTAKLIQSGSFLYADKLFATTQTAQFNTLVMFTRRNDVNFMYPVTRTTKDNASSISLATATDIENFYKASEDAVRAQLDLGTNVKVLINALSTVDELIQFVDHRL